jgi:hypothetical protein
MSSPRYRFEVGEIVALRRKVKTVGGSVYEPGTFWEVTRRFGGYTVREHGVRPHRWMKKVMEAAFRPLTDEERAAIGADGGEHAEG